MDRTSGVAMWRQIEDRLKRDLVEGRWKAGDRLPTEAELAESFGVNRHTLRRAVASLRDAGVLRVEQGHGTFISDDMIDYAISRRTRFSENITGLDRRPSGKVVRSGQIAATTEIAEALEIWRGHKVVLIEAVNLVDERPVSLVAHHFPAFRFKGIDTAYEQTWSITRALGQYGIGDYFRKSSRVSTRLPEASDAEHLAMARTQPILFVESINVDLQGQPIEYSVARSAGHRMNLVFEF